MKFATKGKKLSKSFFFYCSRDFQKIVFLLSVAYFKNEFKIDELPKNSEFLDSSVFLKFPSRKNTKKAIGLFLGSLFEESEAS